MSWFVAGIYLCISKIFPITHPAIITHLHHLLQKAIQVTEQYVRLHHQAQMALMGNNGQL